MFDEWFILSPGHSRCVLMITCGYKFGLHNRVICSLWLHDGWSQCKWDVIYNFCMTILISKKKFCMTILLGAMSTEMQLSRDVDRLNYQIIGIITIKRQACHAMSCQCDNQNIGVFSFPFMIWNVFTWLVLQFQLSDFYYPADQLSLPPFPSGC